jgi:hypothetical protein
MAFALVEGNLFMNVEFEDEDEDVTMRRIQVVWNTDLATTLAAAIADIAAFQAITKCAINRVTFSLVYEEGTPVAPGAGSENQEVGHLALKLNLNPPTGLSKTAVFELPCPVDAIRVAATGPGSNLIDIDAVALGTFLALFGTGGSLYLSHGQTLDSIKDGYVHHKKSKKG